MFSVIHESTRRWSWALAIALPLVIGGCDDPPAPTSTPAPAPPPEAPPGPESRETRLAESLHAIRTTPSSGYLAPNAPETERYRTWIGHLSTSILEGRLPSQVAPQGFVGRLLDAGRVWLISEASGQNRGAGAIALRVSARAPVVVQVPHSFFDEGTLPIGIAVFDELGAQALLVNSVHRGGTGADEERLERARSGSSASDVAHQVTSFFHHAHLELGRSWPQAHVVQLHGFRDEKVPSARIIVSAAGTGAAIAPLARAFNDAFGPGTARLYPEEVDQLGGTQNAQAQANREEGRTFVHLELSASLRRELARQKTLQERFARALAKGLSVN